MAGMTRGHEGRLEGAIGTVPGESVLMIQLKELEIILALIS